MGSFVIEQSTENFTFFAKQIYIVRVTQWRVKFQKTDRLDHKIYPPLFFGTTLWHQYQNKHK